MALHLPPGWTTGQDASGRPYYVNHNTKETTWEHPTMTGAATAPAPHALAATPGAYPVASVPQEVYTKGFVSSLGGCTGPRVAFWTAAGLSWVVWALAVAAAAGDEWFEDFPQFKVADEEILDTCDGSDAEDCHKFKAFSATQIIATILCSVAVLLLTVGFFRPDARCMARAGGGCLIAFAVFQIIAVAIVVSMKDDAEEQGTFFDFVYGDTFGAAVAGFCLGIIDGILLCATSGASGEGLVYSCLAKGTCGECCGDGTTSRNNPAVAQAGIVMQTNTNNAAFVPPQQLAQQVQNVQPLQNVQPVQQVQQQQVQQVQQQQQQVQQVQQQQVQQPRGLPPPYTEV